MRPTTAHGGRAAREQSPNRVGRGGRIATAAAAVLLGVLIIASPGAGESSRLPPMTGSDSPNETWSKTTWADTLDALATEVHDSAIRSDTAALRRLHGTLDAWRHDRDTERSLTALRLSALADYVILLSTRPSAGSIERAREGESHLERALELRPRDTESLALLVLTLWMRARLEPDSTVQLIEKGRALLKGALDHAPNAPALVAAAGLGMLFSPTTRSAGVARLESAAEAYRDRPERFPKGNWWRVITLTWAGGGYLNALDADPDRARALFDEALRTNGGAEMIRELYGPQTKILDFSEPPRISESSWDLLAMDPVGDGLSPDLPDASSVAIRGDGELTWFRIELGAPITADRFGINVAIDTDENQETGRPWWGENRTFTFDRLITAWVVRQGSGRFFGVVGVADAEHATAQRFSNIARNTVRLALAEDDRVLFVGVRDSDLDDDGSFRAVVAVGSNTDWNDDVPTSGWGEAASSDGGTRSTVFDGVRVFDGRSVLVDQTVIVVDHRIQAVGRDLARPKDAVIVDGVGRTLMPGLIDAHVHTFSDASLETAARFGVTTVVDMFTSESFAAAKRDEQARSAARARADLISAGIMATAAGGHGTQYGMSIPTVEDPSAARDFVRARAVAGADFIKIVWDDGATFGLDLPTLDRSTVAALIEEAHRVGLLAVVHIASAERAAEAARLGADGLAHTVQERTLDSTFVHAVASGSTFVIPTLSVIRSAAGIREGVYQLRLSWPRGMISALDSASLSAVFPAREGTEAIAETASRSVAALRAAGVTILAGTDAPNPGTAFGVTLHRELELLVEAGLTPLEALRAATSATAAAFGLGDRGRVEAGMRADLVLVDGNPARDISATRRIVGVWKSGRAIELGGGEGVP